MRFKLAWRNIWRNKRRTLITVSAIAFAVFFSSVMKSMQLGSYARMIDNVTRFYTGYIQIHTNGYWDDKTLDNSFENVPGLLEEVTDRKFVQVAAPRLESFTLASFGQQTKGALLLGVDPDLEHRLTSLEEKLVDGQYFSANEKAVLVSEGLADYLRIGVNDTLVLISQGYHGINSAGKYVVSGLVKFPAPDLNNQLIYLPLKEAQWFYGADNRLTSIAFAIDHADLTDRVIADISQNLNLEIYEIMGWREMLPELLQQIELDYVGGLIMRYILYAVIAFGILGTFLMMVNERRYEFGILMAIGMKRIKLQAVVLLETIMIAFTGTFVGLLISLPIIVWFYFNPIKLGGEYEAMMATYGLEAIMPFSMEPAVFTGEMTIVFVITICLAIYPLWAIYKLKINTAIRQ